MCRRMQAVCKSTCKLLTVRILRIFCAYTLSSLCLVCHQTLAVAATGCLLQYKPQLYLERLAQSEKTRSGCCRRVPKRGAHSVLLLYCRCHHSTSIQLSPHPVHVPGRGYMYAKMYVHLSVASRQLHTCTHAHPSPYHQL